MGELSLILGLVTASIIIDSSIRLRYRILSGCCFIMIMFALIGCIR